MLAEFANGMPPSPSRRDSADAHAGDILKIGNPAGVKHARDIGQRKSTTNPVTSSMLSCRYKPDAGT